MTQQALANYLRKPDDSYAVKKRREGQVMSCNYVELILTSQTWKDTVWKHQLFIIRPSSGEESRHALLVIAGGNWNAALDGSGDDEKLPRDANTYALLAETLRTPVAVLLQVPHQPLFEGRREDELIAYTFEQFMRSGDPEWPLLLPMVKSAVRGMDAIQAYAHEAWKQEIATFTVTGGSKRGWTTWLTSAHDARVTALAPMVIDMLNMEAHMLLQRDTYGEPSREISEYTELQLDKQLASEPGKALQAIVDPYQYRRALKQPKLILLGTNDPYWPLDALNLYWDDLEGEKYVLYVPNNGHGLNDLGRVFGSVKAIHERAASGKTLPALKWNFTDKEGKLQLHVETDTPPKAIRGWTAATSTRDFRQSTWTSLPAEKNGAGWHCTVPRPEVGHAALFAEAEFADGVSAFYLSTQLRIVGAAEKP